MSKRNIGITENTIDLNPDGQIRNTTILDWIKNRSKPDTMFLHGAVSVFFMIACTCVDIAFFSSVAKMIGNDSAMTTVMQVAGLAFGADVVAVYAGIHAKRVRQGLSREWILLVLTLLVPVIALAGNAFLRVKTLPLLIDPILGNGDSEAVAQTAIAIITPILTSIGNFVISYQCYDPLALKLRRVEMELAKVRDHIRRVTAAKEESETFSQKRLMAMDQELFMIQKKKLLNDAIERKENVRAFLKEYCASPSVTNALSQDAFEDFFVRLNRVLGMLEQESARESYTVDGVADDSVPVVKFVDKEEKHVETA